MGVFGDGAAFVGLDVADDVPDDVRAVGELVGFVAPFLDVVFAEVVLPVLVECADGVGGEGFADGDKLHAASRAAGLGFGLGDLVSGCRGLPLLVVGGETPVLVKIRRWLGAKKGFQAAFNQLCRVLLF